MKGRDRAGLAKQEILRGKRNFEYLFQEGRKHRAPCLNFTFAENGLTYNRIAPLVSNRFGNSVFRNYVRRAIKEIYRRHKMELRTGYDICILLNDRQFESRSFADKRRLVMNGLKKVTDQSR